MRKDVIKGTFYSILAVSVITIGIIIIKLGDEQVEPSPFVSIVANKTLEEGKEVYYKERTIPPIRLNPADYARIHKEEIEEFIKKREEDEKNEKKAKEQVEQNEKNDNERVSTYSDVNGSGWETYTATFYTAFCNTGCTGITRNGTDVSNTIYTPKGFRVIAVDTSKIPLNSLVKVKFSDREFIARAADTGGDIIGNRVDVLVKSKKEALLKGVQQAKIKIIE